VVSVVRPAAMPVVVVSVPVVMVSVVLVPMPRP
jgi:hypothetical protein